MKRRFTILTAALALLLFIAPLGMWGQSTYTIGWGSATGTAGTYTNFTDVSGTVTGILSFSTLKNGATSAPAYNAGANELRLYYSSTGNGGSITITPAHGITITGAVMTTSTTPSVKYTVDGGTAISVSASNNTYTVSGISATQSLKFQNVNTSNTQLRILTIAVTYSTTYTVTYKANGGTGEDFVDNNGGDGYESGDEVTVLANEGDNNPNFSKTGHSFGGWCLNAAGTGTVYGPETGQTASYTISANTTFYAKWTPNQYNVAIAEVPNVVLTASYGTNSIGEGQNANIDYGTQITLSYDGLASGHAFDSWVIKNAQNEVVTSQVLSGNTLTVPDYSITVSASLRTLQQYTITFDAGSGSCATASMPCFEGSSIELPTATPSQDCASRGWTFAGWATASVSETTNAPTLLTSPYTINGDATLYAVYSITEGNVFDNTTGGDFMIYAAVGNTNYYATTLDNKKIKSSDDIDEATTFEFIKKEGTGVYAIKMGSKYVSHNSGKTEIVLQDDEVTWTISSQTTGYGSWRITSSINDNRGLVFQDHTSEGSSITYTRLFGSYATSNVDGDDYFDVEIGGGMVTYATSPSCNELVATPTFTVTGTAIEGEENTYNGAISVAINCTTEDATIQYKLTENGEWQNYSAALSINQSTTIWAKATKEGMDDSEVAVATYTIKYTLTVGIDHVEYGLYDYTTGEWNDIEVDSENHALVPQGAEVRISVDMVEDCYALNGFNITYGSTTIQATNHMDEDGTYGFTMPASDATLSADTDEADEHTLTLGTLSHVTLDMMSGEANDVVFTNNEATLCEGINVTVIVTVEEGYVMGSVSVVDANDQPVEVTYQGVSIEDGKPVYSFAMPAADATITATATLPPTYSLVTSIGDLVSGKHYIIASGTSGSVKAMGSQASNNRPAVAVTVNNDNKIVYNENVYEFVINGPEMITKDNQQVAVYTIYDVRNSGYLYAAGNGDKKNYLKNQSFNDDNGRWSISINNDNSSDDYGKATIVAQGDNANKYMRYNGNNTSIFSCYAEGSSVSALPYLYMKDNDTYYEFYKDIAKDTWYFIASPVGTAPVNMSDLTDLYFYDEAAHYWRNKKANTSGFEFALGKGYLAAYHVEGNSPNGVTLTFAGNSVYSNDTKSVDVSYNGPESINPLAGWNLVGNPYPHAAYLSQSFYTVVYDTENSKWVVQASTAGTVAACTGAMVKVDNEVTSVLFSKNAPSAPNNGSVKITLGQQVMERGSVSSTLVDNAIVSFNEGSELPKFYFGNPNANLYIPQGEKEYAILSTEGQGEMPLNFRANADGQYTLTVNPEGVEMNYLHLIDNMTGNDINLLQTPSYSFNAKTMDYESRFRLVFAANNESGVSASSTTFAFYSNGNWMVNNEGEATLQVIDVMGRVLSNQTISGTAELSLNQVPGVYVLRLVNGNDVKTQKIVVK